MPNQVPKNQNQGNPVSNTKEPEAGNSQIKNGLAFVFLPQFRLSFTSLVGASALLRPLLLVPLIIAGLLPRTALEDDTKVSAHIFAAIADILSEARHKNWKSFVRKAPALFAVLGLVFFSVLSAMTFLTILAIPEAQAQELDVFFGDTGNARDLISAIFGDTFSGSGNGGDPASNVFQGTLSNMLLIYNAGMMVVALIIMIYQGIFIFIATAEDKDGDVDSQKLSPGWFAIRTGLVFALLAPLPGSGFSGGQQIIIGLGSVGSSLATRAWGTFAESTVAQGRPISTPTPPTELDDLVGKILIIEACTASANAMAAIAGDSPYIVPKQKNIIDLPNIKQIAINYDGRTGALDKLACGQIKFPYVNQNQDPIATPIIKAQLDAYRATSPEIIKLASELSNHFIPGSPTYGTPMPDPGREIEVRGLVRTWHQNLLNAIAEAKQVNETELNEAVSEQIQTQGWVAAGSWFLTIANANGEFIDAAAALPTITLPVKEVENQIPVTKSVLDGLNIWWDGKRTDQSFASSLQRISTSSNGGSDVMATIMEFIDLAALVEKFQTDSAMPLSDLSAMGHTLVYAALTGFGALGAASVASLGTAGTLLNYVGLGLLTILVPGAILAYWLPILPFIRFLFGILGWLLNLLEAVILAPLFLISHLSTESRGLYTPATRPGYQLLMQLVLRPVLMIFGLLAGLLIFNAIMALFNTLFYATIIGANNGSFSGPISLIVYIMIYCTTAYGMANASFKAIDMLPNRVMAWIGGQGQSEADVTGDVKQGITTGSGKGEAVLAKPGQRIKSPVKT